MSYVNPPSFCHSLSICTTMLLMARTMHDSCWGSNCTILVLLYLSTSIHVEPAYGKWPKMSYEAFRFLPDIQAPFWQSGVRVFCIPAWWEMRYSSGQRQILVAYAWFSLCVSVSWIFVMSISSYLIRSEYGDDKLCDILQDCGSALMFVICRSCLHSIPEDYMSAMAVNCVRKFLAVLISCSSCYGPDRP